MTEQAQTRPIETGEITSAAPRLIEILTPTEKSYPKLMHAGLFLNPENKETTLLELEYFKYPDHDERMENEFIAVSSIEFHDEILPWLAGEIRKFSGVSFNFGDGETIFQDIQEGLIAIKHAPDSEKRRLTSILVGLAEVQSEFETRTPIDETGDLSSSL